MFSEISTLAIKAIITSWPEKSLLNRPCESTCSDQTDTTLTKTSLLKNSGVLPLKNIRRIGVFGTDADYPSTGSGCGPDLFCIVASKRRYWNGTVTIGGGSGAAYADYIVSSSSPPFS